MKFIHRLGYYLGGFSIGLIVLAFFLSGKNVSCDYGPEARVRKNINSKVIVFSDSISQLVATGKIDTLDIHNVLKNGDIIFSESQPRKEPCAIYSLKYKQNESIQVAKVENCDSITRIISFK